MIDLPPSEVYGRLSTSCLSKEELDSLTKDELRDIGEKVERHICEVADNECEYIAKQILKNKE